MTRLSTTAVLALAGLALSANAQELTWQKDIAPMIKAQCGDCHGADAPEYNDWLVLREKDKKLGSRMDTYPHFMTYVAWPATGAMQRRLDDGKSPAAGGKPGNMYKYLGDNDAERQKNLQALKTWLGDGAWNLNRFKARDGVPGITKEQLDAIKAKY
jgi:hypothetical protein